MLKEDDLVNKLILIGLTFNDKEDRMIEQYQTHGIVKEIIDGLLKIKLDDNSIFQLPYDPENISKADNGDYKERSTGKIIRDPDYIITWEITVMNVSDIEEIKRIGFHSF